MTGWLRALSIDDRFPSTDPSAWSIAVLPDTQIYLASYPELFEAQTRWLAENAERLRIRAVLHEGDVVHDNSEAQWELAERALRHLDGRVPYVIALGNHDYGPGGSGHDRTTPFVRRFSVREARERPSFLAVFEDDRLDNSAHRVDTPSGPWLVIALEFAPRDEVVAWADGILAEHASTPAILLTHAYTYFDHTRYDHLARPDQKWSPHVYGVARQPGGVNDGEALYQKLVRRHDSVQLVFSGHVLGTGTGLITSPQDGGSVVHQMLANYQHRSRGGDGYFRWVEIDAARERVRVRTYSPVLDAFEEGPSNAFDLPLPTFSPRERA